MDPWSMKYMLILDKLAFSLYHYSGNVEYFSDELQGTGLIFNKGQYILMNIEKDDIICTAIVKRNLLENNTVSL
jgi:hypothetical protein